MKNLSSLKTPDSTAGSNSIISKLFLLSSLVVSAFWISSQIIDVYRYTVVGVIYEILWFPMIGLLAVLPVAAFIFGLKERFYAKSFYLYSILIIGSTIFILIFYNFSNTSPT